MQYISNMSLVVVLLGAVLVLTTILATVECGGGGTGERPGRTGRASKGAEKELAAAAAEQTDEMLAQAMQEEEDKKAGQNNSGGFSDAAIARDLQIKEEQKAASGKKNKVQPCLKAKARPSDSTEATVSPPGPQKPD